MLRFTGSVVALLLVASGGSPAFAQRLPIQTEDPRAIERAYQVEALQEVQPTLQNWHQAWSSQDARALMRLYTSDALLIVPDASVEPLRGVAAIQAHLDENWAAIGNIRFGLTSAEASGRLLYISGQFFVDGAQAPASGRSAAPQARSGTYVAVLQRQGRGWRFRAQVFRPDGAAGD